MTDDKKEKPVRMAMPCSGEVLEGLWVYLNMYVPENQKPMVEVGRHLKLLDAAEACQCNPLGNGVEVTKSGYRMDEDTTLRYPPSCHDTLIHILTEMGGRIQGNGLKLWRKVVKELCIEQKTIGSDDE